MYTRLQYGLIALLSIAYAWPAFAAANSRLEPLQVGIVPYMSARALVTSYEPMRRYLEQALGKPVKIYTAAGFKPFLLSAQRGDYDLVISAAHFARILQKDNDFVPLVRFSTGGRGLLMTALGSPVKTIAQLRGGIIAVPDQLSLAAIVCMTWLQGKGLRSGIDYHLLEVPSFASAILSVHKGDAIAAISASAPLAQMPKELRESVIPLLDTGEYISLVILSHPRLGKAYADRISRALLKFGRESNEGKQFLASTGFGSIIPVSPGDMNGLDRYVAETKRLMAEIP